MRIGLIGHNSVEYTEKLLEIWADADSAVLIDYDTPPAAAARLLAECGAEYCIVERGLDSFSKSALGCEIKEYNVTSKMPCLLPASVRALFSARDDEFEAVIINSSGTTGKSKGISLSFRALTNNARSIIGYMKPRVDDCFYLNKKLTHASSLTGELLVALLSGVNILFAPLLLPPRAVFRNIEHFGVSILCCNPALLDMYVSCAGDTGDFPRCVRAVYTSGDMISAGAIEKARATLGVPVYNVYGKTECGPRISAQTEGYCHGNSVGRPIDGVEIKLDSDGQILVRTNALFDGYVNRETPPGILHATGDVGYFDENGELFITGRTDNMITVGAHNIFPEEVEACITEHTDARDCIVYKKNGVLACDYASRDEIPDIIRKIKTHLMPHEVPKIIKRVDIIPRTLSGKKIRKRDE